VQLVVHLNEFAWATDTATVPGQLDDIAAISEEGGDFGGLAPDACPLPPSPDVPRTLDVLRWRCDKVIRDFARIERTGMELRSRPRRAAYRGAARRLRWLAGLGIDTTVGRVVGIERAGPLEWLARHVVPAAAAIPSRGSTGGDHER
jgi:hypothetical protein